jgi:hypothetical protein
MDLYITTHIAHNRQIFMSPVGFKPTISAGEWLQTQDLERAATGIGRILSRNPPTVFVYSTSSSVLPQSTNVSERFLIMKG